MRKRNFVAAMVLCMAAFCVASAQDAKPSQPNADDTDSRRAAEKDSNISHSYSGMYTFLKEGEFVQVTVEDEGHVTGFVSRYGDGESDKGAFLDQFFKTGALEGNKLTFTTKMVHGLWYEFKGTVERGAGKQPGDEAYFVLKGTLVESSSDTNKKVTTHSREVTFKMFPQEAEQTAEPRK
jgi:hypothetical protein